MAARNRPRANLMKEDNSDEVMLWNSILDKIRHASALNKKYEDLLPKFDAAEVKLVTSDGANNLAALTELEALHREGLKYSEDELKILHEEPDDLIKNLETLISVRAAFENEAPRPATNLKSRNLKRRRDEDNGTDSPAPTPDPTASGAKAAKAASRSGSVAASVKQESVVDTTEGVKPVADRLSLLKVGAEVFYRNKDKKTEGEGILCSITSILGEGKQRRFEIQDVEPEPDESGNLPAPYRASVNSLVPIPLSASGLGEFAKGKHVYALYPGTTTFYKAEMAGPLKSKDMCKLRFEGEEERDKEMEVERRYVLDTNQIK